MEFVSCLRHPEYKTLYLYLMPDQVEFFVIIVLKIMQQKVKYLKLINQFILMHYQKPQKSYLKSQNQTALYKVLYKVTKIIIQIIQINNLKKLRNWFKIFKHKFRICQMSFKHVLKIQKFYKTNSQWMSNKDLITNPDVIGQLKQKLHQYVQQFQGVNRKEISQFISNKTFSTSNSVNAEILKLQSLDQLKMKIEKFQNDKYLIATKIFPQITKPIQSTIFSDYQQFQIVDLIKHRMNCDIKEIKLIYLGTRDGLNGQSFWAKVNGKTNLLMIFKSKSNYIFGGYSPCQWQQNLGNYVQDNTNSSFLFSQTHDEIYPLVNNQYAIYCNSGYGPTFGGGHSIYIALDFQNGYSNLGHSYQQGSKHQGQYATQLFGQSTPNIIECKIFEITTK